MDYVCTQAGTYYRIVGVEEKRNPCKVGLVLERIAEPDESGRVWEFEWYPRR